MERRAIHFGPDAVKVTLAPAKMSWKPSSAASAAVQ